MRKYTVAVVRERLSQALDEAEQGIPVVIERKGVRYRLAVETPSSSRKRPRKPLIEVLDPAVLEGQWTWDWAPGRLTFKARRRKK